MYRWVSCAFVSCCTIITALLLMSLIDALNRFRDPHDPKQTQYIMHYIFPKQFGLHNAFTTKIDPKETTHTFKDYTLRESEIWSKCQLQKKRFTVASSSPNDVERLPLPKRLRGRPFELVTKLRRLHARCSYTELLRNYCPLTINSDIQDDSGEISQVNFLNFATPGSHVSAFCRSMIAKTIPFEYWGDGKTATNNRSLVLFHIDHFIRARKYETLTLHKIMDRLKVCPWVNSL